MSSLGGSGYISRHASSCVLTQHNREALRASQALRAAGGGGYCSAGQRVSEALRALVLEGLAKDKSVGLVTRSYLERHALPYLEAQPPDRAGGLRQCPLVRLAQDPLKQLGGAVAAVPADVSAAILDAAQFVRKLAKGHLTLQPRAIWQDFEAGVDHEAHVAGGLGLLRKVDELSEEALRAASEAGADFWVRKQDDGQLSTVQRYFQELLGSFLAWGDQQYQSQRTINFDCMMLFPPKKLPFRIDAVERHFNDQRAIESFIRNFPTPKICHHVCKAQFELSRKEMADHVKQSPGTTFKESIGRHLRPLHRHLLWCSMPCYSQLTSIEQAIHSHDVILVQADTGSGKSVFLPQWISHCHNDMKVFVTQPRREPATSVGSYVEKQFGIGKVGIEVAGIPNQQPAAMLQYCTDGLLLERFIGGEDTRNWCVVIDEVHERNFNMDSLFLLCLHRMKEGKGPSKLILASAKVDAKWFQDSVKSVNTTFTTGRAIKFHSLQVSVPSPFPVTDVLPPGGYLAWKNPSKQTTLAHGKLAAQRALDILKTPSHKVLVFLANPEEVREAVKEFESISQLPCCGIHAKAVGINKLLQSSRAIFSNNIAETSLTISLLTHVVDFTTATTIRVDRELDLKELRVDRSSQYSQLQRRGRLGRTAPGEYMAIYDPAHLTLASSCSFDTLSNEHLLKCEMRFRFFTGCTLFNLPAPSKVLGLGLASSTDLIASIPVNDVLEIGASLNMTPGMTVAFHHAVTRSASKECALAILWLSAILESRDPAVPPRTPLPMEFFKELGRGGDHGVLLQLFKTYVLAKDQAGFNLSAWCASHGSIQANFLLGTETQIGSLLRRCTRLHQKGVLAKDPQTFRGPEHWQWDDILEALAHGFWRNCAKRVDHNLKTHDLIGPYRRLDSTQQSPLFIFPNSIWFQHGGSLPEFILYCDSLLVINQKKFMQYVCEIPQALLESVSRNSPVTQSIGLQKNQHTHIQGNTYLNANFLLAPNFSPAIVQRLALMKKDPQSAHLAAEIVVTGDRVQVSIVMDKIAQDLLALALHQQAAALAKAPSPAAVAFFKAFGTPPATEKELSAVDPRVASRLVAVTSARTQQDLANAIRSGDDTQAALAICNILVQRFGCKVKGGAIRDAVVRGIRPNDIDSELSASITPGNWNAELQSWVQAMQADYGMRIMVGPARNITDPNNPSVTIPDGILKMVTNSPQFEFELIPTWNTLYSPQSKVDFSVNNLCVKPGSPNIEQIVPIGLSTMDIVQQLLTHKSKPNPQASPVYDIEWIPGGGKFTDGYNKKMKLEAKTPIMEFRLGKLRKKNYWLVEAVYMKLSATGHGYGQTVVLYHGTPSSNVPTILSGGFKISSSGNLGPGVYMSRTMSLVTAYAAKSSGSGNILSADVDPGTVVPVTGFVGASWQSQGDTGFLDAKISARGEEWCIRDPARITNIKVYK